VAEHTSTPPGSPPWTHLGQSLYEQVILGYGPIVGGLSQIPLALTLIAAAGLAAPLMARLGSRIVLAAGLAPFIGGLAWLGMAPADGTFLASVLGPSLLVGIELGTAFVPVTSIAMAGVPASTAGVAGGLVNTSQQIGGALGLAALATLAAFRTHATWQVGSAVTALGGGTRGHSGPPPSPQRPQSSPY